MMTSGRPIDLMSTPNRLFRYGAAQNSQNHQIGSVNPLAMLNAQTCRCGSNLDQGTGVTASLGSLLMYASSDLLTRGCSAGTRYSGSQNATQISPAAPVMTKAACQPQVIVIQGTRIGARMAPMFEPELNRPIANDRSFLGNHSATVLMAAGKLPASATPRKTRQTPKPKAVFANAWAMLAMLQKISATV